MRRSQFRGRCRTDRRRSAPAAARGPARCGASALDDVRFCLQLLDVFLVRARRRSCRRCSARCGSTICATRSSETSRREQMPMNSMPRSVSRTGVAPPSLVALICSAQSGGSCGASTRPRSRTVTSIRPLANSRVRVAAGETRAHRLGLALALAERGARSACRHDEDHLLQHVFGRRRLGAALAPACAATASCSLIAARPARCSATPRPGSSPSGRG